MTITDAFSSGAYSSTGTPFYLEFEGLLNPRNLDTSSSFKIQTTDSSGTVIEETSAGVTVTMISNP